MRLIVATSAILLGLGLVHLIYGTGCWGLQPGGRWSSLLFALQALVTLGAVVYSAVITIKHRDRARLVALGALVVALLGLAVWQYVAVGWRMMTSIHHQGPENLPTFLLTSAAAIVAGLQARMARRGGPKGAPGGT